ncbi:flagellar hook assembly protein FlgD [Helicobacter vulpis]|uniref:flagellar hook assembly protein FlgD n=1 Tax=Helicobacter vulpis TaxID=2316076 RepID=UPI001F1B78A9|nr:flagellar hook assembly protein FlgD [Helicobacter vulpis]
MPIDLAEVTGAKAAMEKKKHEPKIANGLDKDAFMKLFLEQLKNQDPTAPMETDKIITQTAQLTQVEMQEESKKTMKEVADAMQSSKDTNQSLKDFQGKLKETLEHLDKGMDNSLKASALLTEASGRNSVTMIGKIAETDVKGINVGKGKVTFALYFDQPIQASEGNPGVQIFDQNKQLVRTLSLKEKNGQQGYVNFEWDGLNQEGKPVKPGTYEVVAEYNLDPHSNKYLHTRIGRGEVQSVVFNKGKPMLRMGEMVLPMDSALEFYDKPSSRHEQEQHESLAHLVQAKAPTPPKEVASTKPQPTPPQNAPSSARLSQAPLKSPPHLSSTTPGQEHTPPASKAPPTEHRQQSAPTSATKSLAHDASHPAHTTPKAQA